VLVAADGVPRNIVVPKFAELYNSMSAKLPQATIILIAVGTTARNYILFGFLGLVAAASRSGFGEDGQRARENGSLETAHSSVR